MEGDTTSAERSLHQDLLPLLLSSEKEESCSPGLGLVGLLGILGLRRQEVLLIHLQCWRLIASHLRAAQQVSTHLPHTHSGPSPGGYIERRPHLE